MICEPFSPISTAKRFTVFELSLDPDDPLTYLVENDEGVVERLPIETLPVEIEVLGESEPQQHNLYRSHHGFMIAADSLSGLAPRASRQRTTRLPDR